MWRPRHEEGSIEDGGAAGEDGDRPVLVAVLPAVCCRDRNRPQVTCGGGRRVAPTCSPPDESAELVSLNGDVNAAADAGNAARGWGKYLSGDGCVYEYERRREKDTGKGKFSWSSSEGVEGDLRSGRSEGFEAFVGSDCDTYHDAWIADRKSGYGCTWYPNGDYYEGGWREDRQEGYGRYVWRCGNQYVGEWRNGIISGHGRYQWQCGNQYVGKWRNGVFSGRGALIWANGNRYDSHWDSGEPKGTGVLTRPDGSCYVCSWSEVETKNLSSAFYPAINSEGEITGKGSPFWPSKEQLVLPSLAPSSRKRSSVDGGAFGRRSSIADKSFPKICIWDSEGEAGDITCDIIDTIEVAMLSKGGLSMDLGCPTPLGGLQQRHNSCCLSKSEARKPGQTILKGHKNYDLMLNLQLGIRYSVGKPGSLRELKTSDFDSKEKFWTRFPPEGSKVTPPHHSVEFRWKDYCPMVFRHLRRLFNVDPADYMLAICGNDALRELSSPGKSGSVFYLAQDDRFMIKTVKKLEVKVLIKMLFRYYHHVCHYSNSLITKFYGVHCVKPIGGPKVRFIVMGNLFCSEYSIHRRFDLKGSSHGRTTDKANEEIDEMTTLKDLDLNYVFRLHRSWYLNLLEQIKQDCEFLETEGIMDYSLLLGLHFPDDISAPWTSLSSCSTSKPYCKSYLSQERGTWSDIQFSYLTHQDLNLTTDGWVRNPLIRLGLNMPARAEHVTKNESESFIAGGGLTPKVSNKIHDVILYFGMIDILQDYDVTKKLEHAYKSLKVDPNSISAVDPKLYSMRFQDFIRRIFIEDD